MQLELFPDYPRLPVPIVPSSPPAFDFSEAWKAFDYPFDELESMGQSSEQSDVTTYLKSVIEAALEALQVEHFVGDDVFVYYTSLDHTKLDENGKPKPKRERLSPDIFVATPVAKHKRTSFIKEKELTLLGSRRDELRMLSIEMLSDSNYADKEDAKTRHTFYDGLGVEEYIVIHTQPEMSLQVFWRMPNGRLELTLFYQSYYVQMLGISLHIEPTSDTSKSGILYAKDANGERFENYANARSVKKAAQAQLKEANKQLEEAEKRAQEAEQEKALLALLAQKFEQEKAKAELEAERLVQKAEKRAQKAEKRTQEVEEERKRMIFELEELRNLVRVQQAQQG
jgi:hypothetical protein